MQRPLTRLPPDVAEQNLCVRCGLCLDICPFDLIDHDGSFFPLIPEENLEKCTQCGLCYEACPADVNFPILSKELFGQVPDPLDAIGVVQKVFVGYSLDPEIRSRGSSGGVVTELLRYIHRKGLIDQALVCSMRKDRPWQPRPLLARTEKEIIESAQSKYTIVPQMRRINEIIRSRKNTAIVGIPCQIHAYRKFASWKSNISGYVPIVIGLACHSTLEIEASQRLLKKARVKLEEIERLEYRHGSSWPGGIHVTLRNGEVKSLHTMDIKAAFNRLALFYTPKRCLTCIDFSCELSDISVMDPWIRDERGQHPYSEGYSLIIVRNDKAQEILEKAVADRSLFLEEISLSMLPSQFRPMIQKKKIGSSIRIEKLKNRNRPFPDYNVHFPDPSILQRIQEKLDSSKRVFSKWQLTRDLGMAFAFSKYGNYIMQIKHYINKQKLIYKYRLRNKIKKANFFLKET